MALESGETQSPWKCYFTLCKQKQASLRIRTRTVKNTDNPLCSVPCWDLGTIYFCCERVIRLKHSSNSRVLPDIEHNKDIDADIWPRSPWKQKGIFFFFFEYWMFDKGRMTLPQQYNNSVKTAQFTAEKPKFNDFQWFLPVRVNIVTFWQWMLFSDCDFHRHLQWCCL